jgi:acetyl-CoA synthetase
VEAREDHVDPERVRDREIDPGVSSYNDLISTFRWHLPAHYNIAHDICDRHPPDRVALFFEDAKGIAGRHTFGDLKRSSDALAATLRTNGVSRGDRVAILLPQLPETIVAHLATFKLGAISVPLTVLFMQDALLHRLGDSGAGTLVMQPQSMDVIAPLLSQLPALQHIVCTGPVDDPPEWNGEIINLYDIDESAGDGFVPEITGPDDPAVIIYTSGTTGNPKGALHGHRFLLGHLPAVELSHNLFPQPGDIFWTPADWAWIGGLINALFSSLHHGVPVVGCESTGRFDPEAAFSLMERYGIRNAFLPPTALRMMAQVPDVRERFDLKLRSIMSGGESLGENTLAWARDHLGVEINEIYGQTEINLVIGNCAGLWPVRPGSMGKAYPGHEVAIIDDDGKSLPPGEIGEIAVKRNIDPVFFLGYWNNPEATREKFTGEWARMGDLAMQDADGYFWFKGRKDDVIITAGYRVGPTEVENALQRHPAVAMAAVVASPDPIRGDVIKAFIRLGNGFYPSDDLAKDVQEFVKATLARHEYPRKIEFVDDLPLTTTGKIRRNVLRELDTQE